MLDISRVQVRNLADEFRGYLSCAVNDEDFNEETVDEIEFGKRNNRSVVASMNEIAFH